MLELTSVYEFSRHHCVAICAFLIPLNLLATSGTLGLLLFKHPYEKVRFWATVAGCVAFPLLLHVGTWLMIGVVQLPTFILSGLGITCLLVNLKAIQDTQKFQDWLQVAKGFVRA
ncbi:conserved hypothetical protein [Gloeothece citriformis PCC 7424]|uniref:Uncharacterized protein n=1 Tax=Gloeothece citriformis (strain PCC 7424) TaxID=65393 RepID=B7KEU3_GLOC7|nr:hypothetical protein [Gloeothece citriformis]ACK69118.1 conserved hypothetical protein [Gloeothece citriformis PCC 7424]